MIYSHLRIIKLLIEETEVPNIPNPKTYLPDTRIPKSIPPTTLISKPISQTSQTPKPTSRIPIWANPKTYTKQINPNPFSILSQTDTS